MKPFTFQYSEQSISLINRKLTFHKALGKAATVTALVVINVNNCYTDLLVHKFNYNLLKIISFKPGHQHHTNNVLVDLRVSIIDYQC